MPRHFEKQWPSPPAVYEEVGLCRGILFSLAIEFVGLLFAGLVWVGWWVATS